MISASFLLISELLWSPTFMPLALAEPSAFDPEFGSHWHDGKAEIAAYQLEIKRYSSLRSGNAVSIFVTEPFSWSKRVKIDTVTPEKQRDRVEVLKLNLMRDFPTGLYDYNTMLSVFAVSENALGKFQGQPAKISYSSQEWCGHVYQQLLPDDEQIESTIHSYFENVGDETSTIKKPKDAVLADMLFHWARGFAQPFMNPGESIERPLLNPVAQMRLNHKPPQFENATFSINPNTEFIQAAEKKWEVRQRSVASKSGLTFRFWVETSKPYRIIKWKLDGAEGNSEEAILVGVKRFSYWNLNKPENMNLLKEIGLKERFPLSP